MGHSAGAHIALHLSNHSNLKDRLVGVVGLSGIYETGARIKRQRGCALDRGRSKKMELRKPHAIVPAYYIAVGGVSHLVGLTNHGLWRAHCANVVTLRGSCMWWFASFQFG